MSHASAALTPRQRLRLARQVVDDGWSISAAANYFRVSYPTAAKWAKRYFELGPEGMTDRSSRPHTHPNRTPQPVVKKIVHLRIKKRLGPVQIGGRLGVPSSTVHAVLVRCKLNRLSHVDVKKLGNIPNGGGWRFVGREHGGQTRRSTPGLARSASRHELMRHAFVHTVIDDNSRVAYAEIHDDATAVTAIGVLRRATSWFADRGVVVERVLSDNGPAYKSHAWREACTELGIKPRRTRPYRPQTNGKIERFHRTMADGWAITKHYNSESARRAAQPAWLHHYNHHRPPRPSARFHPSAG